MLKEGLFLIFRNSVWGRLELTRIGRDIPDNIPSNPPASGPPTATPRTDPAASRAPPDLMEEAAVFIFGNLGFGHFRLQNRNLREKSDLGVAGNLWKPFKT